MQSLRLQESGSCPKIPQGDVSKPRKATLADGRDQRMRTTKPLYQRKLPPMHQLLIRAIDLRVPTSRETLMDLDSDRRVGAQALKPSLVSSKPKCNPCGHSLLISPQGTPLPKPPYPSL